MTGFVAFLRALPRILALLERFGRLYNDPEIQAWMSRLEASMDLLEKGKTSRAKIDAALAIDDSIRSL